jgi:hypothetical protein
VANPLNGEKPEPVPLENQGWRFAISSDFKLGHCLSLFAYLFLVSFMVKIGVPEL